MTFGPFGVEQFQRLVAEGDVVAGGQLEVRLARKRIEGGVAQLDPRRACPALLGAEASPDLLDQPQQRLPNRLAIRFVFRKGVFARDGFFAGVFRGHFGGSDAEGVGANRFADGSQHAVEELRIGPLEVATRSEAIPRQHLARFASDTPQDADGLGREKSADAVGIERHLE